MILLTCITIFLVSGFMTVSEYREGNLVASLAFGLLACAYFVCILAALYQAAV